MRILVIGWSQTGQLQKVVQTFTRPAQVRGHEVVFVELKPAIPYPFPWKLTSFFGIFPETVLEKPIALEPTLLPAGPWDRVIVASQIWFLSPPGPINAFLQSPEAELLRGQKTILLVGCRNMWVRGVGRLLERLKQRGALLTDRVVITQSGPVMASYFTTLFWMLTGRRDALKGLPPAQMGEERFAYLEKLGEIAALSMEEGRDDLLTGQRTASISPTHALGEQIMTVIFPIFARIISALCSPGSLLRALSAYFLCAYIVSSVFFFFPICLGLRLLGSRWIDPWLHRLAGTTEGG